MKAFHRFWFAPLLFVALALVTSIAPSCADDVIIRQFDDAGGLSGWRFDYGGVTNLIEFDATQDASNNPASGSMKVTFGFNAASFGGNNKGAVTLDFPSLDGSAFLTMEMDLKIDTGSATDGSANSGFFQMVIRNTGNYDFNSQFGSGVSTNAGWRHISVAVSGARADIRAITLELYGGAGLTGPTISKVYPKSGKGSWYDVNIIVEHEHLITAIDHLRAIGATGIAAIPTKYSFEDRCRAFDRLAEACQNPASMNSAGTPD